MNKLLQGNALKQLKKLKTNSIDCIVTDPPYGLEFMGKDWDAPWKGQASKEFNTSCKGKLGGFKQLPNHSRINNLKCRKCDKWKFSGNPCKCKKSDFPDARAMAMNGMTKFVKSWGKECLRVLKQGAFAFVMCSPRQDMLSAVIGGLSKAGFNTGFTSIYWTYASGFPKASNIGKMVDKRKGTTPDESMQFAKYLKNKRTKLKLSMKEVDNYITGGTTNYNWFEGRNEKQARLYLA